MECNFQQIWILKNGKNLRKTCFWDIELESIEDGGMREILEMQKKQTTLLELKKLPQLVKWN